VTETSPALSVVPLEGLMLPFSASQVRVLPASGLLFLSFNVATRVLDPPEFSVKLDREIERVVDVFPVLSAGENKVGTVGTVAETVEAKIPNKDRTIVSAIMAPQIFLPNRPTSLLPDAVATFWGMLHHREVTVVVAINQCWGAA